MDASSRFRFLYRSLALKFLRSAGKVGAWYDNHKGKICMMA